MNETVLVVDDEIEITRLVAGYLSAAGYRVLSACNGVEALALAEGKRLACAILDINMPLLDGYATAKELRARQSGLPIIFLTARSAVLEKVRALEDGADDYVVKPFSPRELTARVTAVLRRSQINPETNPVSAGPGTVLVCGPLEIDFRRHVVTVAGIERPLTAAQFAILELLATHPSQVFTRTAIMRCLSTDGSESLERTVDAHIKNLRKALGDSGEQSRLIGTVRGSGYRFIGARS